MSDSKKTATDAAQEVAQPQKTVKMILVPVELHQSVYDALRDLPHRQVDLVLKQLSQCQIADVNVS